jgi:hypothetical protein
MGRRSKVKMNNRSKTKVDENLVKRNHTKEKGGEKNITMGRCPVQAFQSFHRFANFPSIIMDES